MHYSPWNRLNFLVCYKIKKRVFMYNAEIWPCIMYNGSDKDTNCVVSASKSLCGSIWLSSRLVGKYGKAAFGPKAFFVVFTCIPYMNIKWIVPPLYFSNEERGHPLKGRDLAYLYNYNCSKSQKFPFYVYCLFVFLAHNVSLRVSVGFKVIVI